MFVYYKRPYPRVNKVDKNRIKGFDIQAYIDEEDCLIRYYGIKEENLNPPNIISGPYWTPFVNLCYIYLLLGEVEDEKEAFSIIRDFIKLIPVSLPYSSILRGTSCGPLNLERTLVDCYDAPSSLVGHRDAKVSFVITKEPVIYKYTKTCGGPHDPRSAYDDNESPDTDYGEDSCDHYTSSDELDRYAKAYYEYVNALSVTDTAGSDEQPVLQRKPRRYL